jgi:hypothetical protein
MPKLRKLAESKSVSAAVDSQAATKEYLQSVPTALHEEFELKLHSNMDVVVPDSTVKRADYWAYHKGELCNVEVEQELYGLWNHFHRLTGRHEPANTERLDEVDVVIAGRNQIESDEISPSIIKRWFGIDTIVIEDEPALPDYRDWEQHLHSTLTHP